VPLLSVRATPRAFDPDGRRRFVERITAAAWHAESIPDDELAQLRAVVIWSDVEVGDVYWGARSAHELIRSVFADYHVSDGVLDAARREAFADAFHAAAIDAMPVGDDRLTSTSVVFVDVPEGRWGRDGSVQRLPAMAAAAGFEHLTRIAEL
jgi:phenylpyruvate tautomerase PptA (4-oxalocrotonate tautomerase family)